MNKIAAPEKKSHDVLVRKVLPDSQDQKVEADGYTLSLVLPLTILERYNEWQNKMVA